MKKVMTILGVCACLCACKQQDARQSAKEAAATQRDRVEVICFHTQKRCPTCVAIEENTREVVEERFAGQLRDSTLVFRTIDLSQPENKETARQYGASWSSLFLTRWRNGKDSTENLTLEAFAKARTAPEAFKDELANRINAMLK